MRTPLRLPHKIRDPSRDAEGGCSGFPTAEGATADPATVGAAAGPVSVEDMRLSLDVP
eukprot:CAMPEP_0185173230 /NCGR_PEP_ID=MMETSP1139-20130426/23021_1 /TAXON_ID=298111 /ORGANISM="Pavlova sp., Strain CCMP459" /LENGTH=57 /DNA_ID=CAMNT_0027738915 /DNA_START=14 /DNA_END=187 /DNA_ORIENTATION=-